ncbi:hypothetical protein KIH41_04270 [Litoribacter ruber]|uniref:hypothetical protein n=1 Tax=Litoribacter ruber TaxID=702568 RepID=UPI001BD9D86D|nr:hypothetical protein [Litoribacter ruber]MBT0810488.1 hypothetical protein [Litoribacter ruber]
MGTVAFTETKDSKFLCIIKPTLEFYNIDKILLDLDSKYDIEILGFEFNESRINSLNFENRNVIFKFCGLPTTNKFKSKILSIKFKECYSVDKQDTIFVFEENINNLDITDCEFNKIVINDFKQIDKLEIISEVQSIDIGKGDVFELNIYGLYGKKIYNINLWDLKFKNITISYIATLKTLHIGGTAFLNINKDDDVLHDGIMINDVNSIETYMHFNMCYSIMIERLKCEVFDIDISGENSIEFLNFSNCDFRKGNVSQILSNLYVGNLTINSSSNLNFNNAEITNIYFEGNIEKNINISNCEISSINFRNFRTLSYVSLNNVNLINNREINLINSTMDSVEINPSFLDKASTIYFEKSTISGLKIHNLIDFNERVLKFEEKYDFDNSEIISTYREFKLFSEQAKNNYLFQKFKALEYNEILKDNGNKLNTLNWFILYANKLSNNHGTDPLKAFLCFLGALGLFSFAILVCFWNSGYSYDDFCYFYKENFIQLTSPLHLFSNSIYRFSDYTKYHFNPEMKIYNLLYNILIGYLIYQFVASFRKFNR